ncbi:MAG: hypothetical protein RM049_23370 [Nostoc sp. DedQUE04]|uniref:hypothetical protein n=1 Tax=Nostoc sp. DedQUE04 TaxID=3075390 RepID=UPI002AD380AA|nr:hypothetical protein [Nostoc sp. DedQUE04]MDZ8138210.1 hypothetical protein [Nostoc sp. DedQUE04]
MSNRPDSPWHYAMAFFALVRAHGKLHRLIRFVGRTDSFQKSESDNEAIAKSLDDIEGELDSVRQSIDE